MKPLIAQTFAVSATKEGKDAFVLDLTNQMNSVPVDANGKVTFATTLTTVARIIKGADYVRENIGVPSASSLKIGEVTPTVTNNGGLVTIEWKFTTAHTLTSERYVKTIQLTHEGKNYNADYVVRTDKSGAVYDLLPSMTEVPFSRNADNSLKPDSQMLYCGYVKNQNGTITSKSGKAQAEVYLIDTKYSIFYRTVKTDGTFGNWQWLKDLSSDGFGVKILSSTDLAGYQFALSSATTLYSGSTYVGLTDDSIIDIETIPIVREGKHAANLDIDNEMDVVQTDSTLKVSAARNIVTKARIYDGAAIKTSDITKPTADSLAISYKNASGTAMTLKPTVSDPDANGVITISWAFTTAMTLTSKKYDITITVKYGTTNYNAVFTLCASEGAVVHQLQPSLDVISFARTSETDNTLTPASRPLTLNVLKIDGASTVSQSVADSGMTVRYSTSSMPTSKTAGTAWPADGLTGDSAIKSSVTYTNIYIAMFNSSGTLIDRETVPVVKDGVNGSSPYFADLDNEMDSVACDKNGNTTSEQSVETNVSMFKGNAKQNLKSVSCKIESYALGTDYAADGSPTPATNYKVAITGTGTKSAKVKIYVKSGTSINTPVRVTITVTSTIDGADQSKDLVMTINGIKPGPDGSPAVIYNLLPSVSEINVGRTDAGGYSPSTFDLQCGYKKNVGGTFTTVENATSKIDSKYYIYYRRRKRNDQNWNDDYLRYSYYRNREGYSLTALDVAAYDLVEFILCTATDTSFAASALSDYTLIDRETVPVVADGKTGGDGNGIKSVTYYRMFTSAFDAPDADDDGWIVEGSTSPAYPTIDGLSEKLNNFLWQKKVITYTKTNDIDIEIGLLAQKNMGIKENLLEDTSFNSLAEMEAWAEQSSYTSAQKDGYTIYNSYQQYYVSYYDYRLYGGSWSDEKPEVPASRYLWTRMVYQYVRINSSGQYLNSYGNVVSSISEAQQQTVYLTPDENIGLGVDGHGVISDTLDGHNSYKDALYLSSDNVQYKEVLSQVIWQNKSDGIKKIETSEWYTLSFWVKGSSETKLHTYIYPSSVYTYEKFYIDGVKQDSVPSDGHHEWKVTSSWVRHTVTFRTKSSFYNSGSYPDQKVLFRLTPTGKNTNYCYICMPKLEKNTMATEWVEHTNDRMADDIQHVYVGKWSSGTTYYYGGGTGVRHVVRAKENASGAMTYWRMKKRTTSAGYYSTTEPYNDSTNWEKADYLKFVATDFLLADEAIINFAKTNRILVNNSSGTVAAGMGGAEGGDNDYPLWVGANYAQRGNAPFRVTLTGKLFATEANIRGRIEGSVRNPFMLVYDSFSTYDKDNLAMMTEGDSWGSTTVFSLSWDVNQSGRLVRLSSYAWNSKNFPTSGWGQISAPTGKYFYENGRRFSNLYFSREMIELIGYGTDTQFYGWVVVKRVDFMTEKGYGMENRCLMMGRIKGRTTSDGTTVKGTGYRFDGNAYDSTTVSLSRISEGNYKLSIPTAWKLTEDSIQVQLTPIGYVKNSTSSKVFNAVVLSFDTSGGYISAINIWLSDDDSANDGDVFYAIYNMEQFLQWAAK